jgi:hypothetical protein
MMQRVRILAGFALMMIIGVVSAEAQLTRNVNDAQVRAAITRLESRTNTFKTSLERHLGNQRWSQGNARRTGGVHAPSVSIYISEFESAIAQLKANVNARRSGASDMNLVLHRAAFIEDYVRQGNLPSNVSTHWRNVKNELDQLARFYGISWNWNQIPARFPQGGWNQGRLEGQLSGTYRLNAAISDNVHQVISRVAGSGRNALSSRQRQSLEARLAAPQDLAINLQGNVVTMSTNYGQPVTFTADGRTQTEQNDRRTTTRTTATLMGNTLSVNTEGDRNNDYWVSFTPVGTNQLRMTRRIYLEGRNEMVSVTSVYDRTSNVAQFPNVNTRPGWNTRQPQYSRFYIPNGTQVTAVLRNRIATNITRLGDQFTMDVMAPAQYRGAVISGRVVEAESSGRVSGRANLVLDFESIRIGNQTYGFAGIIDSAREPNGSTIRINNEGTVQDGSQTTRVVTRAGIGAGIGALIGAIVGGGQGAAIGAGVGAGAGAGTVLIQGRDNLDIPVGSEFRLTASSPASSFGNR